VRYCTAKDGVRIAYCVEGEGPPLLVCADLIESFAVEHVLPELQAFFRELAESYQLIRFDQRGVGLSQRHVEDQSLGAAVSDLEAVVRAAGLKRFAIWASSAGGTKALTFAARHQRQLSGLVLFGSWARATDLLPRDALLAFASLWRSSPEQAARNFPPDDSSVRTDPETSLQSLEIFRQSADPEDVARMFEAAAQTDWDATPLLGAIRTPTLVLHRRDDQAVPIALSHQLAAQIPGARLVPLPGRNHLFFLEDRDAVINALHNFLGTVVTRSPQSSSTVRTVLFTDLVGHTEMMSRLGDERGRDVLREHERITRGVLKAHGGTEVKTMGDGFMASFGSVTKAVECAIALQKAIEAGNQDAESPLARAAGEGKGVSVRVGLNAGEPIEEDGDLFGATVILASRIAANAGGGEILVADTVRGLCSGKGFLFADRGEFVAKGFEEPVRVYEVSWRE
ncbi:MAG TPA: adenylate/guanylate cyclase domain-containing protein, partial [Dehalococcoidia bacterium]